MKLKFIAGLALIAMPTLAMAGMWVEKPILLATGDSYTRRTPCTLSGSYDNCDSTGQIKHELSYATHLNAVTKYNVVPTDNSARGGETCTLQAAYADGVWVGERRGLLSQVDTRINNRPADVVSILIGINDVNSYGVADWALRQCLVELYSRVTATGRKVVAMTYPPISSTTPVWGLPTGVANNNRLVVNRTIREAVTLHNEFNPNRRVHLAETSGAWTSSQVGEYTGGDNAFPAGGDGTHPNVKGAVALARKWYTEVCSKGYIVCKSWFN